MLSPGVHNQYTLQSQCTYIAYIMSYLTLTIPEGLGTSSLKTLPCYGMLTLKIQFRKKCIIIIIIILEPGWCDSISNNYFYLAIMLLCLTLTKLITEAPGCLSLSTYPRQWEWTDGVSGTNYITTIIYHHIITSATRPKECSRKGNSLPSSKPCVGSLTPCAPLWHQLYTQTSLIITLCVCVYV